MDSASPRWSRSEGQADGSDTQRPEDQPPARQNVPSTAPGRGEWGQRLASLSAVVCVHDKKMDERWCLVASEASVPTRVLIRYYGKRWGIEAGFRDIKEMRFGMGLTPLSARGESRGPGLAGG